MSGPSGARRLVVGLCVVALLLAAAAPGGLAHAWALVPAAALLDGPCVLRRLVPPRLRAATSALLARTTQPRAPPVG